MYIAKRSGMRLGNNDFLIDCILHSINRSAHLLGKYSLPKTELAKHLLDYYFCAISDALAGRS